MIIFPNQCNTHVRAQFQHAAPQDTQTEDLRPLHMMSAPDPTSMLNTFGCTTKARSLV
jgi:hypothetical protein